MKRFIFLVFASTAALLILAAKGVPDRPMRLEIINKTNQEVFIRLRNDCCFYYLWVPAQQIKTFTVNRQTYTARIIACNRMISRQLDLYTQTRITFPSCIAGSVPKGEDTMIKIPMGGRITATPLATPIIVPP